MGEREHHVVLVPEAFPPERERATRAVALGLALGLILSIAGRARSREDVAASRDR